MAEKIRVLYCPNCEEYLTRCYIEIPIPIEFGFNLTGSKWECDPPYEPTLACSDAANLDALLAKGQPTCPGCEHPVEVRQLDKCPHDEAEYLFNEPDRFTYSRSDVRVCQLCGHKQKLTQRWVDD